MEGRINPPLREDKRGQTHRSAPTGERKRAIMSSLTLDTVLLRELPLQRTDIEVINEEW